MGVLAATAVAVGLSLVLAVLTGSGDVPDNWGFRGFWLLQAVLFAAPGAVVLWRRAHPVGWTLLVSGLVWAIGGLMQEYLNYDHVHPGSLLLGTAIAWVFAWYWIPLIAPAMLVVALFPDGRYPSARWRLFPWALAGAVVGGVPAYALRPGPLENIAVVTNPWPAPPELEPWVRALGGLFNVWFLLIVVVASLAPVIRFRTATGDERQQLKWFAYAASIVAVTLTINLATAEAQPARLATAVAFGLLPVAVGLAILRYRLYDIDVLINRTLVYGTLTGVLGVTYYASVVALQTVLRPLTTGSEVAVAVSTLAVVALVQPLRRRMQEVVDRRFYRSRYNAAQTLDTFTARLRDEVDLDQVSAHMVDVVGRTVAPEHASLWLRRTRT